MVSETHKTRPRWFWPLIAFLIGLLVGWLVIGWALWPVTWKNTLPQDLRAAERDQYLTMVAESLANSGDGALAQQRLQAWPREELAADLKRLQERLVSENSAQAAQVQTLDSTLGIELIPEQPAAEPQPASRGFSLTSEPWRTVCAAVFWVILVLIGVALIAWFYSRWRRTRVAEQGPVLGGIRPRGVADREEIRLEEGAAPVAGASAQSLARSSAGGARESYYLEEGEEPPLAPTRPSTAAPPARGLYAPGELVKVGDFRAVFQMGEPDYEEAFTISDSTGAYVGECGMALESPIGQARDQAAALQVWLYDRSDPDTKVIVLMGEGSYRDTALRAELAGEHDAIAVRPGAEFELESYNLVLRGTVERLEYADQEPPYGVFAELLLRLQVYRKGQ